MTELKIVAAVLGLTTAISVAFLGWRHLQPFEEQCAQLPSPRVQLHLGIPEEGAIRSFQLSAEHLKAVDDHAAPDDLSVKSMVAGFVQLALTPHVGVEVAHREDAATGARCFTVNAEVRLEPSPLDIHVLQGIPPGSCTHADVVEHEREHVKLYQQALAEDAGWLQARIEEGLRERALVAGSEADLNTEAMQAVVEEVRSATREAYARWNLQHKQVLDTPEEYERFTANCGGQTELLLNELRHRYERRRAAFR